MIRRVSEPPLCERIVRRYAGMRGGDAAVDALLREAFEEARRVLQYTVSVCELTAEETAALCARSARLAERLDGCRRAVALTATLGVGFDRLLFKYGALNPAKALLLEALGTERIEALCDAVTAELETEYALSARARFSPGYGDLPLSVQQELLEKTDAYKTLGVSLTEGMMMSPQKSVTAIVGFADEERKPRGVPCEQCDNRSCEYRGAV